MSKGTKNDQAKPDLSLIPTDALWDIGRAFTYGKDKYGRHNFREGIEVSRLLAAAMRHITQYNEGEDIDYNDGPVDSFEEAQLNCLKRLILTCNTKNQNI